MKIKENQSIFSKSENTKKEKKNDGMDATNFTKSFLSTHETQKTVDSFLFSNHSQDY
jgi:hypothetical protein